MAASRIKLVNSFGNFKHGLVKVRDAIAQHWEKGVGQPFSIQKGCKKPPTKYGWLPCAHDWTRMLTFQSASLTELDAHQGLRPDPRPGGASGPAIVLTPLWDI